MPDIGPAYSTGKGPYRMQTALWKASLAVAVGDLIYKDASDHYDKPASSITWNATLAATQEDFHDTFRGVSMVRRTTAQTADGTQATDGCIACSGEFFFPCTALQSALYVANNQWITIDQGVGNTLNSQKVIGTTVIALAIGKLTRDAAVGATWLAFEIVPALGLSDGLQTVA